MFVVKSMAVLRALSVGLQLFHLTLRACRGGAHLEASQHRFPHPRGVRVDCSCDKLEVEGLH